MTAEKDQSMKKTSAYTRREFMKQMAVGAGMALPLSLGSYNFTKSANYSFLGIRRLPYKTIKQYGARVKVFGVGESGQNAIFRLFDDTGCIDKTIEYVLIDAEDSKYLMSTPALSKEQSDEIRDIIKDSHLVFILAGLEQDATAGVVPEISDIGKKMGVLTVTVASIPSRHEWANHGLRIAQRLEAWCLSGDCVINLPENVSLNNVNRSLPRQTLDSLMADAVSGICQAIFYEGFICLDFADIKQMISATKDICLGVGWGRGDYRSLMAVTSAVYNLRTARNNQMPSKRVFLMMVTKPDEQSIEEMEKGSDILYNLSGDIEVNWGTAFNNQIPEGTMQAILYGC